MARNDALLKLHQRLVERRNSLRSILARDMADLNIGDSTGDEADAAFDSGAEEVNSSLAEIEARELHLIEKAISKLKHGTYGICEHCSRKNRSGPAECLALQCLLHGLSAGTGKQSERLPGHPPGELGERLRHGPTLH